MKKVMKKVITFLKSEYFLIAFGAIAVIIVYLYAPIPQQEVDYIKRHTTEELRQEVSGIKPVAKPLVKEEITVLEPDYKDQEVANEKAHADEMYLFANVVYAEAGDQGLYGMQLVADVILNRLDAGYGNTITEVLYAPGQFSCVTDGGIQRHPPTNEAFAAIEMEMQDRTNTEVFYFKMWGYHSDTKPLFQYKDHYFSGRY